MNPADKVIPLLDGVKATSKTEWVAKCPAHDDRHPSLVVREADDGRLLMHCFCGCGIDAIMQALGLSVSDLFAAPLEHRKTAIRHPFSPAAVLRVIGKEALLVAISGKAAMDGALTESDRKRMIVAIERLQEAAAYA